MRFHLLARISFHWNLNFTSTKTGIIFILARDQDWRMKQASVKSHIMEFEFQLFFLGNEQGNLDFTLNFPSEMQFPLQSNS